MKWLLGLLAIIAIIVCLPHASATVAAWSACSQVFQAGTLASDAWSAGLGKDTAVLGAGVICTQAVSGDNSITNWRSGTANAQDIYCQHVSGGTGGPQAPTTLELRAYWGNAGNNAPTQTAVRVINMLATCGTSTWVNVGTIYCTSDGTNTGSPRYGLLRYMLHVASTGGITPYDVNSDSATTAGSQMGVLRCLPDVSATNVTATGTAYHIYIGGDTLRSSITASASDPTTGSKIITPEVTCGSLNAFPTIDLTTGSAVTSDLRIIGATNTWVDDCGLILDWRHTNLTTITVYNTIPYGEWNSSQVPGGTTVSSDRRTLTFDPTDNVDRSLTATASCSITINGASSGTTAIRQDLVGVTNCAPWQDARSNTVTNNQPARGWHQSTATYRSASSYPSQDGLFGASGTFPTSLQSTNTAVITTSNGYHKMVETFDATARTDAVLLNWGNTSGIFDVTATGTITSILNSKTNGGANASSFTIGTDIENVIVQGIKNSAGQAIVNVNMTCQRTRPDTTTETAVNMGASDASGNTANSQFQVLAPQGTWQNTCTGTMNGNTWTYNIHFFHVSAFTANIQVPITWNATKLANGTLIVNMSACLRELDQASDTVLSIFPDDVVKLTVENYNAATNLHDIYLVSRAIMQNDDGPTSTCYSYLFYTSPALLAQGAIAMAGMNFTGNSFLGAEGYYWVNSSSSNNGNFSGNFTGNVTDMAAVPQDVSVPIVIMAVLITGHLLAYVSKTSIIPTFMGLVVILFDGLLVFQANAENAIPTTPVVPGVNLYLLLLMLIASSFLFRSIILGMEIFRTSEDTSGIES